MATSTPADSTSTPSPDVCGPIGARRNCAWQRVRSNPKCTASRSVNVTGMVTPGESGTARSTVRCRTRPWTTTGTPLNSESRAFSAARRHAVTFQ